MDGRDMPGQDGWTICSWRFHPIVVPARGLGDCGKNILTFLPGSIQPR
jgi:hypothetical protein